VLEKISKSSVCVCVCKRIGVDAESRQQRNSPTGSFVIRFDCLSSFIIHNCLELQLPVVSPRDARRKEEKSYASKH